MMAIDGGWSLPSFLPSGWKMMAGVDGGGVMSPPGWKNDGERGGGYFPSSWEKRLR